jgi:hypothetical protein
VTVHTIRVEEVTLGGTVATCLGVDQDSGERVAFYVEHREAEAIAEAVQAADDLEALPVAEVESWQLAGR